MMEIDLRARLVAALPSATIAWVQRPAATGLPAITLQKITGGRSYNMKGADALHAALIQVDCWGATYGDARTIATAAIAALEPRAVQGSTRFDAVFVEGDTDMPPEDVPGDAVHRVTLRLRVWYAATA